MASSRDIQEKTTADNDEDLKDFEVRPEDLAWSRAHPLMRQIAYGVMLLLSLSSTLLGIWRGRLGAVIISIVVVVALSLVILGLVWIADRKERFWKLTGNTLITAALGGIVTLFLVILFYIGTGYPVWLDVWFGNPINVPPPNEVSISDASSPSPILSASGSLVLAAAMDAVAQPPSRNVIREDDGSFKVVTTNLGSSNQSEDTQNGIGLVRDRRSRAMIAPIASYERKVSWNKNVSSDAEMEVQVKRRGSEQVDLIVVPARDGFAKIADLRSNEYYEYRVTQIRKGRRSSAVTGCFATPLDFYPDNPQHFFPQYITYYSAERNCEGNISSSNGEIVFEALQYYEMNDKERLRNGAGVARWIYKGTISNGKPTWNGTYYADPLECIGDECGVTCDFSSPGGNEGHGKCRIFFGFLSIMQTLYGGKQSTYIGSILATESGNRKIGPVRYDFGVGALEAVDTDYTDVYKGDFRRNDIQRIKDSKLADLNAFRDGALLRGKEVLAGDCLLSMIPQAGLSGTAVMSSCHSLELGEYRGQRDQFNGIELQFEPGSSVWLTRSGKKSLLPRPVVSGATECLAKEQFAIRIAPEWDLDCEGGDGRSCTIMNSATDTNFRLSIEDGSLPSVLFSTSAVTKADGAIHVDEQAYDFAAPSSKDAGISGLAMAAQFCAGKSMKTPKYGDVVALDGFCPTLAVGFARLVNCGL
jgi:hypothetical protein